MHCFTSRKCDHLREARNARKEKVPETSCLGLGFKLLDDRWHLPPAIFRSVALLQESLRAEVGAEISRSREMTSKRRLANLLCWVNVLHHELCNSGLKFENVVAPTPASRGTKYTCRARQMIEESIRTCKSRARLEPEPNEATASTMLVFSVLGF